MTWIANALRDLRQAWRMVIRTPALATVVVLSVGAGIGVNTVVFSWIQARVLHPLPGVSSGGALLGVEPRTEAGLYTGSSWQEYRDLRAHVRSLPDLLAFRMAPFYIGETGRVERAYGLLISDNYFGALGVKPFLGRFPDDPTGPGAPAPDAIAVISYGLWQTHYRGSPAALGQSVRVNGRDLTIVGVTPQAFQGTVMGLNFEVWVPATLAPTIVKGSRELDDRNVRGYSLMGRLAPGATRAQAQSELDVAMRQLAQAYPETNATLQGEVLTFWESPRGPQRLLTGALALLQAVMLLLLLAVCGNMANLVLARASSRQKEMGVRLALGARPSRIVSLLLIESLLLTLAGAALGAAIAAWGTSALLVLPLSGLPIRFQTNVDWLGLLFAMALGVGCGVLVGAAPAALLARVNPQSALRAGARASGRSRMRHGLMGAQVALALVVLIVAGLFLESFKQTRDTDPGFRREGVLLAAYDLTGRNATPAFTREFPGRLLERLRARPGIEEAALASSVPLDIHGLPSRIFTVEGRPPLSADFDQALANTVTPGYLRVMGIPLLAGTDFAPLDDTTQPPQVIVNDAFVAKYLASAEPGRASLDAAINRRLLARGRTFVIVGIARTSLYNAFGEAPTPLIYFSYRDLPLPQGEIHVRTRTGVEAEVTPDVRRAVRDLDPELPIFNVRTLGEHVETNLVFRRVPARMFAVLGPLLLVLVAIGIYAVVAYTVSLRSTEIGVRQALGATPSRLVGALVTQSLGVIGLGAVIGWVIAFTAYVLVTGEAMNVPIFVGVPVLLLTFAAAACWWPAWRATKIDPVAALKQS